MASEERDRKFDQALARHLRSAAVSPERAAAAAPSASPHPDPETLAAYHERGLSPEEMNFWKNHIVACGSCQSVLAHLEQTDGIPVHFEEREEQLANETVPELAGVAHADEERSSLIAASLQGARDRIPLAAKKPESRFLPATRWRWLVPAGAIAAVLLVWIAMHENRSMHNESEPKIAYNAPAAPAPVAEPMSKLPSATSSSSDTRSARRGVVSPSGGGAGKVPGRQDSFELREESRAARAPALGDKEMGVAKDAERRGNEGFSDALRARDMDRKSAAPSGAPGGIAGAAREKGESSAQIQIEPDEAAPAKQPAQVPAQTADDQLQKQVNGRIQKVPGPAPLSNQVETHQKLKKAAAPPAAPASDVMNYKAAESLTSIAGSNLHLIPAPGGSIVWRAGSAGRIEFSKDKGVSWSSQASGVSADFLAGSAPSEKICWIVGRAGTILLTMDGGAHWKLLGFLLTDDLGGVDATSALHATVLDLRTTQLFETTDGGQTWKLVRAQ